mmetsp:Transcript_19195/g.60972  ORF Transcript_19195/g.60972 Transcript_19195/m.60972 type:complete len:320 (+) Transcript_19195:599-1558(+)
MAAIEEHGEPHALWKMLHDEIPDVVVCHHARLLEVHRQDGLIHAVFLVTMGVLLLCTVAREVEKEGVSRLHALCQPMQPCLDIVPGGHGVRLVVHERPDAAFRPVERLDQQALHAVHVVQAASQLSTRAEVVHAHQQRTPLTLPARLGQGLVSARRCPCTAEASVRGLRVGLVGEQPLHSQRSVARASPQSMPNRLWALLREHALQLSFRMRHGLRAWRRACGRAGVLPARTICSRARAGIARTAGKALETSSCIPCLPFSIPGSGVHASAPAAARNRIAPLLICRGPSLLLLLLFLLFLLLLLWLAFPVVRTIGVWPG